MDTKVLGLGFGLILVKTYIKEIKNIKFPNLKVYLQFCVGMTLGRNKVRAAYRREYSTT